MTVSTDTCPSIHVVYTDDGTVCFQDNQLPGVEVTAIETSVERWDGLDKPVDLVLLFNVIAHVKRAHHAALFQQLTRQLAPDGIIIIITEHFTPTHGGMLILERLGKPLEVSHDEVERDMLSAGFTLVYSQDITGPVDYSNPSDDLVKYFRLLARNEVSEQEVRAAIDDVARPNTRMDVSKKMGIFEKSTQ